MNLILSYRIAQLEATIINDVKSLRKSTNEATIAARRDRLMLDIGKLIPFYHATRDEMIRCEALEYTGAVLLGINPKYGIKIYDRGLELIGNEISRFNRGNYTAEQFINYKHNLSMTGMFGNDRTAVKDDVKN